jgi:hypothetical protein
MAEAAKSARGAFDEIKSGSGSMAGEVGSSMCEARHGVMMLGEEFGVHLPRGLTTFIASIGPVGAAMEAAFPFLAIALGATLLLEHLMALKEAGEKLTDDQAKFGTAAQMAFNGLDDKLLQSQIKMDDLTGNHLGALHKQLELIDHQSMAELAKEFGTLAKSADAVFSDLKSHWYTFGIGSSGAKHALDEFQQKYESLLAQGKSGEAADLLKGTRESAEKVLALQKQASASSGGKSLGGGTDQAEMNRSLAHEAALNSLKQSGVGFSDKEVEAQQTLVDALAAQVSIQGKVGELKKQDSANATRSTAGTMGAEKASAAKAAIEAQLRMGEQAIAADRSIAAAELDIKRASAEDREIVDVAFADREVSLQLASNAKQIAALDKLAKDYPNQLKAMHEKAAEISAQYGAKVTEINSKAAVAAAAKVITDLEQSEREKIEATRDGSSARLAAIDAAINAERALHLQDTSYYRDLENQKTEVVRQAAEEQAKLTAQAAAQESENTLKMGEMAVAAARSHQALLDSTRRLSFQQGIDEETRFATQSFALQMANNQREIAALNKGGNDYANKLKELQNKEKQMIQAHENEVTGIKEKAETQRNHAILAAEQQATSQLEAGLTQSIMGHQTWAHMLTSFASQAASSLIQHSLAVMMQQDKERLGDAKTAAANAYKAGTSIGGPAAVVVGAAMAAAAFAGVMAFNDGTDRVPGIGTGDVVPARLTPGEGVVPGGVMDGLRTMARNGQMNGGGVTNHAHVNPTYHLHAVDADGMEKLMKKHATIISKHVGNEMRRMNK